MDAITEDLLYVDQKSRSRNQALSELNRYGILRSKSYCIDLLQTEDQSEWIRIRISNRGGRSLG